MRALAFGVWLGCTACGGGAASSTPGEPVGTEARAPLTLRTVAGEWRVDFGENASTEVRFLRALFTEPLPPHATLTAALDLVEPEALRDHLRGLLEDREVGTSSAGLGEAHAKVDALATLRLAMRADGGLSLTVAGRTTSRRLRVQDATPDQLVLVSAEEGVQSDTVVTVIDDDHMVLQANHDPALAFARVPETVSPP